MDKRRQDRGGPMNIDYPLADVCHLCNDGDPQVRSAHQLRLAHDGLDSLRSHLQQYYAKRLSADDRQQYIDSICGWVGGEMSVWSGYADPQTGMTLPWWAARRLAHAQGALGLAVALEHG